MARRDSVVQTTLAALRELIAGYEVGQKLPNEKDLADDLNVSRASVREALGVLANEQVVTRRWGAGTFVSPTPVAAMLSMSEIQSYRDRVEAQGRTVTLLDATCEPVALSGGVAEELAVPEGTAGWLVSRLFAVDGMPSASMDEHVPLDLMGVKIDPLPMLSVEWDLFRMLRHHLPDLVQHTVTDLSAVAARGVDAERLAVRQGDPLIRGDQVTYGAGDVPLAVGVSLQRTDRVRLRITR